MLQECKQALRITTDAYDGELCSLMQAAVQDLRIAGVTIPGAAVFSAQPAQSGTVMEDMSTLRDPLILRAVYTYVRLHFGSPGDYERLKESYNTQKVQLMHAGGYTAYAEDDEGGEWE